jgi:hypothetical protein
VSAVAVLVAGGSETTVTAVAARLDLDKSAALRRVRVATERGYLRNLEEKRGRPARIVLGEPLPDEQEVLPQPAGLQGCSAVDGDSDQPTESTGLHAEYGVSSHIPQNGVATVQPPSEETEEELLQLAREDRSKVDALQAALGWPPREEGSS